MIIYHKLCKYSQKNYSDMVVMICIRYENIKKNSDIVLVTTSLID